MKVLLSSFLLIFIFAGCKKNRDYVACRMTQLQNFENGSQVSTTTYEYDGQGRVKKISYDNQGALYDRSTTYEYYSDSVVVIGTPIPANGSFIRTTYFLNNTGLATSARNVNTPNPNGLQLDYTYTYNSEGYLIQERTVFSQVYVGVTLRDTMYSNFTITNGNVINWIATQSPSDRIFEYSSKQLPPNIPELNPFPSRVGPFLGKRPNNLISRALEGGYYGDVSYIFDRGDKVSEMTSRDISSPGSTTWKTVFHYDCN